MSTQIDKLLPTSIYALQLHELKELQKDVQKFSQMLNDRIAYWETPPTLGVSVEDKVKVSEKIG